MTYSSSAKVLVISFLVSGFFYTLSYKLQGSQIVSEGKNGEIIKTFFHPYVQALTFFIGQSLCAIVLYYVPDPQKEKNYKKSIFIIPAISDLITVMMQCTALALISGSTFMMLKGASLITTLAFSHWLIHMKIKSRHIAGCGLAVIGLIIVGIAQIYVGSNVTSTHSDNQAIGYTLMILSLITNGFLYAYEQKLLTEYQVSPLQMVGWEGIYGAGLSFIVVMILSFVPCPFSPNKCVYDKHGEAFIQLPSVYLSQIFSNFFLLLLVIAGIVTNAFYNYYGVTITKTMDSLTRSLLNVCRTSLLWLFGLTISLFSSPGSPYRIQSLKFSVNLVKLIGFAFIVSGTLIYNRILLASLMEQLDQKWMKDQMVKSIQYELIQKTGPSKINST